jgi:hypothetical protein
MSEDRPLTDFVADDAAAGDDSDEAADSDVEATNVDNGTGAADVDSDTGSADTGTDADAAEANTNAAEAAGGNAAGSSVDSDIEPATPTYRWQPEGATCADCGATTERQWRDDDAFVCADCKSW